MRKCLCEWPAKTRCPGLPPLEAISDDERARQKAILYHMLKRSLAEDEGDPEAKRIAEEAREESQARRRALAWERAKEALRRRDTSAAPDVSPDAPAPALKGSGCPQSTE